MDKGLRRLLELSGQIDKNEVVKYLNENFAMDGSTQRDGFEGPFNMANGRVVYYNLSENKYYDSRTAEALNEQETAELRSDIKYIPGFIVHASKGDDTVNLRVESLMEMRPLVSSLRGNGYDKFEMSDEEGNRSELPDDIGDEEIGPDAEIEADPAVDPEAEMDGGEESHDEKMDTIAAKAQELASLAADVADGSGEEEAEEPPMDDVEGDMGSDMDSDIDPDMDPDMGSPERGMREGKDETVEEADIEDPDKNKSKGKDDYCRACNDTGKVTVTDSKTGEKEKDACTECDAFSKKVKKDEAEKATKESLSVPLIKSLFNEDAAPANIFDKNNLPFNAVDDLDQLAVRTGRRQARDAKNLTPKDIIKCIDTRITELNKSIDEYDNKGYNDISVKGNAIDVLEKLKEHLKDNTQEGLIEAQLFLSSLMSPIRDMLPDQLYLYLHKGADQ